MFCPSCGKEGQQSANYCKNCGEWLPDLRERGPAFGGLTPQQNIFTGLFMSAISVVAALFSAIALYATYLGAADAKWSVYVAAAFCVCIVGWQASSLIIGLRLQKRLKRARAGAMSEVELSGRETQRSLAAGDRSLFVSRSVTENTTELLNVSPEEYGRRS